MRVEGNGKSQHLTRNLLQQWRVELSVGYDSLLSDSFNVDFQTSVLLLQRILTVNVDLLRNHSDS